MAGGGEKKEESSCSGSAGKTFCSKPKTSGLIENMKRDGGEHTVAEMVSCPRRP